MTFLEALTRVLTPVVMSLFAADTAMNIGNKVREGKARRRARRQRRRVQIPVRKAARRLSQSLGAQVQVGLKNGQQVLVVGDSSLPWPEMYAGYPVVESPKLPTRREAKAARRSTTAAGMVMVGQLPPEVQRRAERTSDSLQKNLARWARKEGLQVLSTERGPWEEVQPGVYRRRSSMIMIAKKTRQARRAVASPQAHRRRDQAAGRSGLAQVGLVNPAVIARMYQPTKPGKGPGYHLPGRGSTEDWIASRPTYVGTGYTHYGRIL